MYLTINELIKNDVDTTRALLEFNEKVEYIKAKKKFVEKLHNTNNKDILSLLELKDDEKEIKCPVCYNDFTDITNIEENVDIYTTCCGHIFCDKCFLKVHEEICPVCRRNICDDTRELNINFLKENGININTKNLQDKLAEISTTRISWLMRYKNKIKHIENFIEYQKAKNKLLKIKSKYVGTFNLFNILNLFVEYKLYVTFGKNEFDMYKTIENEKSDFNITCIHCKNNALLECEPEIISSDYECICRKCFEKTGLYERSIKSNTNHFPNTFRIG